jgi:hypothetical protein
MKRRLTISVDISEETLKKIKIYCIKKDVSFKDLATTAVEEKAVKLGIIKRQI